MENNNKYTKYLAIFALLVSVVGLSLGFAAFSTTVSIQAGAVYSSTQASENYRGGVLSTVSNTVSEGNVTATTEGGATADTATLTEDTISNIVAHFTASGQSVEYSFYGFNDSEFPSYLNSVVFGTKSCTAGTGATDSYVQAACNDINMYITAGDEEFTETETNVVNHPVDSKQSEVIKVTIEYINGGATADGDFTVDFGTTVLTYSTVD